MSIFRDPSKLLTALKNRCSEIKLDSLSGEDIYKLLRRVSRKENIEISKQILEEISENCDGSPRKALVILEKILGLTDEKQIKEIISIGEDVEAEVIELCRILLKTKDWKEISKVLKAIKETDYEKIRYAILGYMNSTLINSGMGKAALIIDCFIDPFYNCGKAGINFSLL